MYGIFQYAFREANDIYQAARSGRVILDVTATIELLDSQLERLYNDPDEYIKVYECMLDFGAILDLIERKRIAHEPIFCLQDESNPQGEQSTVNLLQLIGIIGQTVCDSRQRE